jgi:hypothetical protein
VIVIPTSAYVHRPEARSSHGESSRQWQKFTCIGRFTGRLGENSTVTDEHLERPTVSNSLWLFGGFRY